MRAVSRQTYTARVRREQRKAVDAMESGFAAGSGVVGRVTITQGLESIAAARVRATLRPKTPKPEGAPTSKDLVVQESKAINKLLSTLYII